MTDSTVPGGLRSGLWSALASLVLSSSTLVCCALPALLVALGAGATLAGLITAVPQLVWLSTHKGLVFGAAGVALAVAAAVHWRTRGLPCPADPALARACTRTRRASTVTLGAAVFLYGVGAAFAFVPPLLMG